MENIMLKDKVEVTGNYSGGFYYGNYDGEVV